MYSRATNSVANLHGGGGNDIMPSPRATLPPAPPITSVQAQTPHHHYHHHHHHPHPHVHPHAHAHHHHQYAQHPRSPPPPPPPMPYSYDRQGGSHSTRQHYIGTSSSLPYPTEADYMRDSRYPPPSCYHPEPPSHMIVGHSHNGRSMYGVQVPGSGRAMHEQMDYGASLRPNGSYVPEGIMLRGPQNFYEKTGDQCPTYVGYIKSAQDAILLLSACDLASKSPSSPPPSSSGSMIPPPRRVTRRLLDAERADMVSSGCVFAWDEKEAGMKRWTDGRVWSASRVSGCFLTYRELEARKKSSGNALDGPTSNQYKPEGLIKQSFSVTTASGRKLHVISYFTKRDVREGRLRRVSEDPRFVGEGGGEWGLKVDKEEYSFPDGQHRVPGQSDQGGEECDDDEEEDDAGEDSDDLNTPPPQPNSLVASRKRSLPDELAAAYTEQAPAAKQQRPPLRPMMIRKRSSSLSQMVSSTENSTNFSKHSASFQSSASSNATSVSADSAHNKSHLVRALVSPTLPRESAIRGSASDMHPTHSQDSANAVGALLSLAGNRSDGCATLAKSNLRNENGVIDGNSDHNNNTGLGLSVKPSPDRRDSDQTALDMFRVRL